MLSGYTFELPLDRGEGAWERHGTETTQIVAESEAEAWASLIATYGGERANLAKLVSID